MPNWRRRFDHVIRIRFFNIQVCPHCETLRRIETPKVNVLDAIIADVKKLLFNIRWIKIWQINPEYLRFSLSTEAALEIQKMQLKQIGFSFTRPISR